MKKVFLLLAVLFTVGCSESQKMTIDEYDNDDYSRVITMAQAEECLNYVLDELDGAGTRSGKSAEKRVIKDSYSRGIPSDSYSTRTDEDDELYVHVFNFEDDMGTLL